MPAAAGSGVPPYDGVRAPVKYPAGCRPAYDMTAAAAEGAAPDTCSASLFGTAGSSGRWAVGGGQRSGQRAVGGSFCAY